MNNCPYEDEADRWRRIGTGQVYEFRCHMPHGRKQRREPELAWQKYFNQNGKRPVLALLSLAAYLDNPPFLALGAREYRPTLRYPERKRGARGLAYTVFDEFFEGRHVARIVAYRGTELRHLNDWIFGNIPLLRLQHRAAVKQFPGLLAGIPADVKVHVTGHSLGGGIAITIHRYYEERLDITRVFNASPIMGCLNLFRQKCENDRELIREHYRLSEVERSRRELLWANVHEAGDPTRVFGNVFAFWRWGILNEGRDQFYRRHNFLPPTMVSDHDIDVLTYHIAGYQTSPRHDVATAAIALQCLRESDENPLRCEGEIRQAQQYGVFESGFLSNLER
jgi:hypothetical protein